MPKKLTIEQRHALTRYYRVHRNGWKRRLRSLWSSPCPWSPLPCDRVPVTVSAAHGHTQVPCDCVPVTVSAAHDAVTVTHDSACCRPIQSLGPSQAPTPVPTPDDALLLALRDTHGERWLRDASIANLRVAPMQRVPATILDLMRRAPALQSQLDPDGVTVWRQIDIRRVRELAGPLIDPRGWGGILSALKSRSLYKPIAACDPQKNAGYGWVRVLRSNPKQDQPHEKSACAP
jgi:hypothetical protein